MADAAEFEPSIQFPNNGQTLLATVREFMQVVIGECGRSNGVIAMQQYELSRATKDKERHVLCYLDKFYSDVPHEVRTRGPWQVLWTGEVVNLQPGYRQALARDGFVYVEAHPVGFRVEA